MKQRGFTLIEVVMVMLITGIMASLAARMIESAFASYFDLSGRVQLQDGAELSLRWLRQDVHEALPNSLRVACGGRCLELLHSREAGRYRANQSPGGSEDVLNIGAADSAFELVSHLHNTPVGSPHSVKVGNNVNDCQNNLADCLVIFNTGSAPQTAYQASNRATITALSPAINPTVLQFRNHNFAAASAKQLFYVVDTPVTYLCDPATGNLTRYQGYTLATNQAQVSTHAQLIGRNNPAEFSLLSEHLTQCSFQVQPGSNSTGGLLGIALTYQVGDAQYNVFTQVEVQGVP